MSTENTELKLDVVTWERDGIHVGQCLQYDVAAQATNPADLRKRMVESLAVFFVERIRENEDPFAPAAAPPKFWAAIATGTTVGNLPIYVKSKANVRATFQQVNAEAVAT